jgi:NCS1 family nucleobase:cation symporter-1
MSAPAANPPADSAHLSNADLAPVPIDQRNWSMWHIAALWIGMAVCIPTYTIASGMISQGMSWWQAMLTVMLGNVIVLAPLILNGHGGTKYGVPFPVLVRATFGVSGAHVPAIARALVACGWFGIQSWIGGWAIYTTLGAVGWIDVAADVNNLPVLGITALQFGCFLAFWAINLAIVVAGIDSIKWLEAGAAPFLLACGVALLVWAFVRVDDPASLFNQPAKFENSSQFWAVFFPQLTAMVGFWATLSLNIPDFTRYCKSQRDQALGQAIGLPTTMTLFCFIGIIVTAATVVVFGEAVWDPVELVGRMGSPLVVAISMIALTLATLSTNLAANVVSPANGFSNLAPGKISFRTGAIITCLIGVAIMPWRLYLNLSDYIFTWLIGYSALLGPIAGVMLCDYFVLRKTRLNMDALYDAKGEYAGVNHRAMLAMSIAVLPNIPGFLHAATGLDIPLAGPGEVFGHVYTYAWFVGLAVAFGLYYLLARSHVRPAQDSHPAV